MMGMVLIMILAFFVNLVLTKPDMGPLARGFIPSKLTSDSLNVVAALMATSFALAAALYQSYLTQDKGWSIQNLKKGLSDTYTGILILAIITATILITAASALHPRGITVHSAADMALQMEGRPAEDLLMDVVHPTPDGHDLMARILTGYILDKYGKPPGQAQ